jgi:hypothetical protein
MQAFDRSKAFSFLSKYLIMIETHHIQHCYDIVKDDIPDNSKLLRHGNGDYSIDISDVPTATLEKIYNYVYKIVQHD